MTLNVKYQRTDRCTVTLTQTESVSNTTLKVQCISKNVFSDGYSKYMYVQIFTICTISSQNCLGKDPKSLSPLPKHKRSSYIA